MEDTLDTTHEDKPCSRCRGPTFQKEEVNLLLNLIEKYKSFILNKCTNAASCQAKDAAWRKIAKQYNSHFTEQRRTSNKLRIKWENMKRDVKRLTKNVLDSNSTEVDSTSSRVLAMMTEAESITSIEMPNNILEDDDDYNTNDADEQEDTSNSFAKDWDENLDSENETNEKSKRMNRSLNFSPQECALLLECVKKEKKFIFSKAVTKKAVNMKNSAWMRIADSYNKLSPEKRSAKVLKTKFFSLKYLAKSTGSKDSLKDLGNKNGKHEKNFNHNFKGIKKEPFFEDKMDAESDPYEDDDEVDDYKPTNNLSDPLSSVLNCDSGIGSMHVGSCNCNQSDNKEIVKLKTDLLNYKMETAKLERKRIEDTIQADLEARESHATETALRLRTARLEAIAAAMKLPPAHPALHFTPEETRAQHYLSQYL